MQKTKVLLVPALVVITVTSLSQARAQQYDPQNVLSTDAWAYARYYVPYAVQANAAYVSVDELNKTTVQADHMKLVLKDFEGLTSKKVDVQGKAIDIYGKAKEYLRAWRYQFGSTCRKSDRDCWLANSPDRQMFETAGPKFHVWARYPQKDGSGCSEVSIAFRGTTSTYEDIKADAHPVAWRLGRDDHYQRLHRNIDALIQRIIRLNCYRTGFPRIVAVGHSLGGGLAQLAALANPGPVRIDRVIAFNSSPWTGAPMLDRDFLNQNVTGLEIDRVHQVNEPLRKRTWFQQDPQDSSDCVRRISYEVIQPSWSPKKMHNMTGLAGGIIEASYLVKPTLSNPTGQLGYELPPELPKCPTRYRGPADDNDDYGTPPPAPAPQVATRSSPVRLSANQADTAIRYASRDGFEFSQPPELSAVPVKLEQQAPRTRVTKYRSSRAKIASR